MNRQVKEKLFLISTTGATLVCSLLLISLISIIFYNGLRAIDLEFLFTVSRNFGVDGGIFYQIIGSLIIVTGAACFSLPIALGAALCSSEFISSKLIRTVTTSMIYGLNGVPSIIFGIFGLIFFVNFLGTGLSWFVGSIILGSMILPTIMVAILHSMEGLPDKYRESAHALGLDRWRVITSVVIPQSLSGAVSGLFIGLARAIGETAPIMFIATAFSGVLVPASLFEPVTTLPTHILALAEEAIDERALTNAWGAASVLIALVFIFSLSSLFSRIRLRRASAR